jgi:hypothetical protein
MKTYYSYLIDIIAKQQLDSPYLSFAIYCQFMPLFVNGYQKAPMLMGAVEQIVLLGR